MTSHLADSPEGASLTVSGASREDLRLMYELYCDDPLVRRRFGSIATLEAYEELLSQITREYWIIAHDGVPIGQCMVYALAQRAQHARLAIDLLPSWRRRGLLCSLAAPAAALTFDSQPLRKVYAHKLVPEGWSVPRVQGIWTREGRYPAMEVHAGTRFDLVIWATYRRRFPQAGETALTQSLNHDWGAG